MERDLATFCRAGSTLLVSLIQYTDLGAGRGGRAGSRAQVILWVARGGWLGGHLESHVLKQHP